MSKKKTYGFGAFDKAYLAGVRSGLEKARDMAVVVQKNGNTYDQGDASRDMEYAYECGCEAVVWALDELLKHV